MRRLTRRPWLALGLASLLTAVAHGAQVAAPTRAAAIDAFNQRIQAYMTLRGQALKGFPPLKPDANQATVAAREAALGQAIRRARAGSHAGEIFTSDVARIFRQETKADFERRSTHDKKLRLDELPHFEPVVNQTYPSTWPLQTFPPTLLQRLPSLPPELEYRFVDNALILRDTKANIVVDVLRDVM